MPGPTTEALDSELKTLETAVHAVDVRLAKVETKLSILLGVGSLFGVAAVTGFAYALIWFGSTNAKLDQLGRVLDRIESRLERVEGRPDRNPRSGGDLKPQ